jgi:TolB-like protein/predicted Ser/Thr protein kinase
MIGKTISHYKILDKIGDGGMGVVYKAEDTSLGRVVALKLLPPELERDAEAKTRLVKEARAASTLDHPNICTIHEIGEAEGAAFIAMAFVEGRSLKEALAAGPLKINEAVEIALQVAAGLEEAHEKRVIHRDIKPANIMITPRGRAKIMDFGLALSLDRTRVTKAGTTLGTIAYMSPEQTRAEAVDRRADIWSLGVVLYEMLSGRRPFAGDYDQTVIYSILNEAHEPVTGLRTGIPMELERIVDKCLAKDPSLRYQHADELATDLRRLRAQGTAAAGGGSEETSLPAAEGATAARRRGPSASRFRPVVLGWTILAAAAVAIGAYYAVPKLLGPRQPGTTPPGKPRGAAGAVWENSIAVLPFRDLSPAGDQEYVCAGMTDALNGRLSRIRALKVIATCSVMRFKGVDRDIREIAAELGVDHVLEGSVQRENDRIRVTAQLIKAETGFHLWSESYDERVESIFDVQDRITTAIAAALRLELARGAPETEPRPRNLEAYEYYIKGMSVNKSRYVVSFREEDFASAVAMLDRSIEIDSDYAPSYLGLAWAYEHHYQVTDDTLDAVRMQQAAQKALALDPLSGAANAVMAYAAFEYGHDVDGAFRLLERALELNPNDALVNFIAGAYLLYVGLYERAVPYLEKSLALDPYYFWTPYKLGWCRTSLGEYEAAGRHFDEYFELAPFVMIFPGRAIALEIRRNNIARVRRMIERTETEHPDYRLLPYTKALLLAAEGRREEALALYENSEIYGLLGMADEALACLDREIRGTTHIPYIFYLDLVHNPFYENIRGDIRFQRFVRREKSIYDEYLAKYGTL